MLILLAEDDAMMAGRIRPFLRVDGDVVDLIPRGASDNGS